ncbi:MAG: alpha/beta hydrolase [Kordiimonadaceae bacterium]|nr:alpha/beta hydrolase [Kordiimonadaceae bacterium]
MKKIIQSIYFWLMLLSLPLFLVGCSNLFMDFDSKFESDAFVARKTIQTATHTISYLSAGDPNGQRVIFVHGTPGDAGGNWYEMLKNVPEGYEFLAIDRPGFGKTTPNRAVTSLDGQAAALAPLLAVKNGKGPILVGHSLGGPVIVAAATNYPERVGGLVIAAGALDPNLEEVLFIQHVGDVPPFSWLLNKTLKNSNKELIALEDELRLLQPKLASITQPVVIVHGTEDNLVPYANVPFMTQAFTGSTHIEVTTLDGMNHFLQWRAQDEINAAIETISVALGHIRLN